MPPKRSKPELCRYAIEAATPRNFHEKAVFVNAAVAADFAANLCFCRDPSPCFHPHSL
jgi:hypothetical protein